MAALIVGSVHSMLPAVITPGYTPHARAERLIATGRFVLAFCSLIAVYLEPSTPAKYAETTYALLSIYTVYAVAMVVAAWHSPVPRATWRLASHALDLVLFSIFIYLTEGPASPFFPYFIFSLFCATLRFSWRGILATGVAASVIYAATALVAAAGNLPFEPSRVVIRDAYLAVITALLVYLGMYQQRLRSELASLAAWPRDLAADLDETLRATLAHAAGILGADRILLAWEDREEPWTYTAEWVGGYVRRARDAPRDPISADGPPLQNMSFALRADGSALMYEPGRSVVSELPSAAVREIAQRFSVQAGIGACLQSETTTVYLMIPSTRSATGDDLALAHIVGRLALATLEQFLFLDQVRQTAGAEERLRISRELHDGIVQSLGGVGLQLQAIRSELPAHSQTVQRLEHVQRVVEHDQRELRAIVRELRPHDGRNGASILEDELQRMSERFPLEWGLEVDMSVAPPVAVTAGAAREICRIVNESLSNAARHGGATHASVTLETNGSGVDVTVADNGRGFPFAGRFSLAELEANGQGPRTLKERVATLGGSLTIESAPTGARVIATIPAGEALS